MKLLWAVQRYGPDVLGGSEVAGRDFAHQMVQRGHEVTVLTSCAISYSDWANHFEPGESELDGVRVIRLPVHAPRNHHQFGPLHSQVLGAHQPMLTQQQRWSRLIGPDLVGYTRWLHENLGKFDVAIFKAYLYSMATRGIPAAFGRAPILFNPEAHPEEMLNLSLHESTFRLADALQFHSYEEAELVCRRFGFVPPHEVVGIGLKDYQFETGGTEIVRKLGLSPHRYAVIVGRIDAGKGSFEAIEYFNSYRRRTSSDLKLVFVGERTSISDLGDSLVPTGFVSEAEKRDLISQSLCLVQPSYLESFSIVLTEAWALGRPVLVQDRSAVLRGQTRRANGGLTFRDYESFEAGLTKLESCPGAVLEWGESGRRFVQAEYLWPTVIKRFETAVDKAIDSHARRHSQKKRFNSL